MKRTRLNRQSKSPLSVLQRQCDKLFQEAGKKEMPKSIISGKPTEVVHHFVPKGLSSRLRYDWDNAIPLTNAEHFAHHIKSDPIIHATVIKKRGDLWYELLTKKKQKFVKVNREFYEYHLEEIGKHLL